MENFENNENVENKENMENTENPVEQKNQEVDVDFGDKVNAKVKPDPEMVKKKVVSSPEFFGWMMLFGIPVIGFIACLIVCFLPKRKNLKHFARGYIVKSSLVLCTVIAIFAYLFSIFSPIMKDIREATNGVVDTYSELIEIIDSIDADEFAEYFELIDRYEKGEIEIDFNIKEKIKDELNGNEGGKNENDAKPEIDIGENDEIDADLPEGYVSKDADASVEIGG